MRNEDLDLVRCRPEFVTAMKEDLRWLGFRWEEPMISQSARIPLYRRAVENLHGAGLIYPCNRSRRDVLAAVSAPHDADESDEPLYPVEFRPPAGTPLPALSQLPGTNWRFRVPEGTTLRFQDGHFGEQRATAGHDFGDFLVWRKDDLPSYQLACVVDDAAMKITEVVRGADLMRSTFRQLLLYRALGLIPPRFYHCPLVTDETGQRLAKRHHALAIRTLREQGHTPAQLLEVARKDRPPLG